MFVAFLKHIRAYSAPWIVSATVLFCTLVALVLTFLNGQPWLNYVASYSIGISCMSTQMLAHKHRPASWNREWVTVIAAFVGLTLGLALGGALGAFDLLFFFRTDITGLVIGGVACGVAGFVILLMGYIRDLERERDIARRDELVKERELALAQLQTLQAQIEPHFLFNTLANLQSLIDSDSARASQLLDALAGMFRFSLAYARSTVGTVGEEIKLISSYLQVQQIRLGDRLAFDINVAQNLADIELPPFLVQPLVENAIKHGIEPSAETGRIRIEVQRCADTLTIVVANSGVPFDATDTHGVGLANLRERLASIYGAAAALEIEATTAQTLVTLTIPYEFVAA